MGQSATARVTINAVGELTGCKIMNGGCNYYVGEVLNVTGTATTTGFVQGTVTVQNIQNNIGDTISSSLVLHPHHTPSIINFIPSLVLLQPEKLMLSLDSQLLESLQLVSAML